MYGTAPRMGFFVPIFVDSFDVCVNEVGQALPV